MFSTAYIDHLTNGPFPGQIDPWAEAARYFQQVHSGMIDHILAQIQRPLLELGYIAGKETSLQIMHGREPDVYVERRTIRDGEGQTPSGWNYAEAATAVMAEPGIEAESTELEGIRVTEFRAGILVSVLEVISPGNKIKPELIEEYQSRRHRLLVDHHVNVVEIDATRSVKRLLTHELTALFDYHIAVYQPTEWPRIIGNSFGQPLKRFALPLREQVVPVEPQSAYNHAYRLAAIAGHIYRQTHYAEGDLPFPSLLTSDQRRQVQERVAVWLDELTRLGND